MSTRATCGNAGASDVKWAQKATLIERGEE
jgi:hypothetical protein